MVKRFFSDEQWERLAEAARYDVRELAGLCNLSCRHMRRIVRRELGRSPQDWLTEQRILAAQRLLLSGQSVKQVAFAVGFKQSSHFCRQFRLVRNMTPMEFVSLHLREPAQSG